MLAPPHGEGVLADANLVVDVERERAFEPLAVDVGAVGAAQVADGQCAGGAALVVGIGDRGLHVVAASVFRRDRGATLGVGDGDIAFFRLAADVGCGEANRCCQEKNPASEKRDHWAVSFQAHLIFLGHSYSPLLSTNDSFS